MTNLTSVNEYNLSNLILEDDVLESLGKGCTQYVHMMYIMTNLKSVGEHNMSNLILEDDGLESLGNN